MDKTNLTGQELLQQKREYLSKQMALIAEASKKCKPCDLLPLTQALVLAANEITQR